MLNYPMGSGYGMGLGGLGMMGLGGMGMGMGLGMMGLGMGMGYPYGMMMQNPYGYSGMVSLFFLIDGMRVTDGVAWIRVLIHVFTI